VAPQWISTNGELAMHTTPITAKLVRGALELQRTEQGCYHTGCPGGPGRRVMGS
jgi:hypothetical protein